MSTTAFLNITNQECPNCGVSISIENDESVIQCKYCDTQIKILRPINVSLNHAAKESLSLDNRDKYDNYITILQNSMIAGNYKEAFDYCNKALEINPAVPELWVNKAICAYWQSTKGDILSKQAKETSTYLRTAQNYDPENEVLKKTKEIIAENLFYLAKLWANRISPDTYYQESKSYAYSWKQVDDIYDYIMLFEIAYNISEDVSYLKAAIDEFILHNTYNIGWIDNENVIRRYPNIKKIVNQYAEIIRKVEPQYNIPEKTIEQSSNDWSYYLKVYWWIPVLVIAALIMLKNCV